MKEIPSPLTPEEKRDLEGMPPTSSGIREAVEGGLFPTEEEILQDLELKALSELPEEMTVSQSVSKSRKEEKSSQEQWSLLKERGYELKEELRDLLRIYNQFCNEYPSVRSEQFKERFIEMNEKIELVIQGFYNPDSETGSQKRETYYSLRNQAVQMMINIVNEEIARMKSKFKKED